ncbi:MAG: hypothetical protein IKV41_06775 [Oscillospiraceae bacterium]|nr:hypothetical protein [Oscillospiraceae bacterium]
MKNTKTMVIAGLLCAVGIVIPMFSPIKVVLEPASFTLASHVAVFIAMFISPAVAVCVALGTTLGFFIGGFPIVVVMRALTHVIFAYFGAVYIQKHSDIIFSVKKAIPFSLAIGILHALCEVVVVMPFYLNGNMNGYALDTIFLLVGVGSAIHSMVDFAISQIIWAPVSKTVSLAHSH